MMRKRNHIEEILSIKSRAESSNRFEFQERIYNIENAINEYLKRDNEFEDEILKYIPITLVSCIESFGRSIIAELIDAGIPFSENVLDFNQSTNIKFDFSIVNAIQKNTISIGDFISHFLPCNNIQDFNSNISVLIKNDLFKEIKSYKPRGIREMLLADSEKFKSEFPKILNSLNRVFELRHIFCHEYATNIKVERKEVLEIFEHCKLFLNQVNDYISNLLHPNSPITDEEMLKASEQEVEKLSQELENLISKIKEQHKFDEFSFVFQTTQKQFDKVINLWKEYSEAKATIQSQTYSDKFLSTMTYNYQMSTLIKNKIVELKDEYHI
jgi:hypothetical protein